MSPAISIEKEPRYQQRGPPLNPHTESLLQPPGYHHQHAQKYQVEKQRRYCHPKQQGNHDQNTRCQSHMMPIVANTQGKAIIHNIVFRIMLPPPPTYWSVWSVSAPPLRPCQQLRPPRNKTLPQWQEHRRRYPRMNRC